jgi:hypothetical protein
VSDPEREVPSPAVAEEADAAGEADEAGEAARERRPLIERIGLAGIALVLAILFGGVSAASWAGGEPFLAVMAGIGCLMTLWVGALTLMRG